MRLFTAIELPDEVLDQTELAAKKLRRFVDSGRFPGKQNYHITLNFLGEVHQKLLDSVISAMDSCSAPPFELTAGGLGRFARREGDVIWRRVEVPEALLSLQEQLSSRLKGLGFELENRRFTPHITLARGVVFKNGHGIGECETQLNKVPFTVSRMALMESRLIGGRRIYTPLHHTEFRK